MIKLYWRIQVYPSIVRQRTPLFAFGYFPQRRWCSANQNACHNPEKSPPVWQSIIENIQTAVLCSSAEAWLRFCEVWRQHFPQQPLDSLTSSLEEERLIAANNVSDTDEPMEAPQRIPSEIECLSVYVQALSIAAQMSASHLSHDTSESVLLRAVAAELRTVALFMTKGPLRDAVRDAARAESVDETQTNLTAVIPTNNTAFPFPSHAAERVDRLGVKLSDDALRSVIVLCDAAAAVAAMDPPPSALPAVYHLLLPALGACEQLDSRRLAALATALACCADFDPSGDIAVRSSLTSYTALSHLHAVARALEVRMKETLQKQKQKENGPTAMEEARLRLLSLKERKAIEKTFLSRTHSRGDPYDDAVELFKNVSVVCSALASLRYADEMFWHTVTEFTCTIIESVAKRKGDEVEHVMGDVRSVLFALDYVRQTTRFDNIMSLMVSAGLLAEPISPPSEVPKAMKVVKGATASNFTADMETIGSDPLMEDGKEAVEE